MSVEGPLSSKGEVFERFVIGGPVRFDMRPGMFEATRGLGTLLVIGQREADGWKVGLRAGGVVLAALSAGEARKLAAELADYADLIELGWEP